MDFAAFNFRSKDKNRRTEIEKKMNKEVFQRFDFG